MIQVRMESGELPIHYEPRESSPRVGSLGTPGEELLTVLGVLSGTWMQVARSNGRPGWIPSGDPRLRFSREVRVRQSMAAVLPRTGHRGEPLRLLKRNARLTLLRIVEEAGERWVRVRLPSGREGFVAGGTRVVDYEPGDEMGDPPHAWVVEVWLLRRGVVGGLALLLIAAAWFFIGREHGYIFYYPPALALLGVFGVVSGWRMGKLGALETAARLAPPEA